MRKKFSNGPKEPCAAPTEDEKVDKVEMIVMVIRAMHGFLIASHLLRVTMDSDENNLIIRLFRVLEIFFYIGTILYQQFYILLYPSTKCEDKYVFFVKSWMLLELFIFYSLVVNASAFLAYIQCRGAFGNKNWDENKNRFKFDALDYYEIDIEWCSF